MFHLESELLADLGRVDEDERVVPDELRAGLEDRLVDVVPDRRVGHVPAQALFDGVALPRVVVDRAHDHTPFHAMAVWKSRSQASR